MIIFGTGHRPEKCNLSFTGMTEVMKEVLTHECSDARFAITGMAAGFDLAFAVAAIACDIPVWCVKPWAGHRPRVKDIHIYDLVEDVAVKHTVIHDKAEYPGPWVYHVRNEFMVDHADKGYAMWNGKESGGTYGCLQYAAKHNMPITNIW